MISAPAVLKTNTPTPTRTCAAIWKILTAVWQLATCLPVYTEFLVLAISLARLDATSKVFQDGHLFLYAPPHWFKAVPQNLELNTLFRRYSRILHYKGL